MLGEVQDLSEDLDDDTGAIERQTSLDDVLNDIVAILILHKGLGILLELLEKLARHALATILKDTL